MNKLNLRFSIKNYVKRYLFTFAGLFVLAFAVALSTRASLGTSPVSSLPYVLSLCSPITMGTITIIIHAIFIALQLIILKKNFPPVQILQLGMAFIFGFFTDLTLYLTQGLILDSYLLQWIVILISCCLIGIAISMELSADLLVLPYDGFVRTMANVTKIDVGKIKIIFDCIQVGLAAMFSFIFLHELLGVREGTVAAAILCGFFVKIFNKNLIRPLSVKIFGE